MADLTIKQSDIQDAITFLTQYLSEQVPEATFTEGSAIRDLVIKAFAPMFAFLRSEVDRASILQSLLRIQEEVENGSTSTLDTVDVSQAVDALLSNWFVYRKSGTKASGTAQVHFTRKTAVVIRRDTKFWRTPSLAFYPDVSTDSFIISESQLRPIYDTSGRLVDYVANVPIIATFEGEAYDFEAGRFIQVEVPGGLPFFAYAEHQQSLDGGQGVQDTADFISDAATAITVRNLINNRSIDTILGEYVEGVRNTLTIGMGEPEMVRDLRREVSPAIDLHVGGHYDTYLDLPETQMEENGTVGGMFPRPDGLVSVFRDPELTYDLGNTFTSLGIQAGHVLYVVSGIVGAPRGFTVVNVTDHALYVSESSPFDEASDELDTNAVLYSVGWYSPSFDQCELEPAVYSRVATVSANPLYAHVTAGSSRRIAESGAILLSGNPVQDVITVEITDPDTSSPLVDPATETLRFTNRVNTTPITGSVIGTAQYQVECINPSKAQSMENVTFIRVGTLTAPDVFDGKNLRVLYRSALDAVRLHEYVRNYSNRVVSANHLVKLRHPIWVYASVPYRLKTTAIATLPEGEAQALLANHINIFDPNDDLDMSDLATALREAYTDIVGTVFPFTIEYDLHAPDGQIFQFETTDIVSIFPKSTNGVTLVNQGDIVVPDILVAKGITAINTSSDLLNLYKYYGISDRTVTYKSRSELITFTLRG